MDELDALFVNSLIFATLLYILTFVFLRHYTSLELTLLMTPVVWALSSSSLMMRVATPDMMLAFFSFLSLFLIIKKKYILSFAILLFSVFIRNDSLLRFYIIIALLLFAGDFKAEAWKKFAVWFIVGVGTYLIHTIYFPAYKWTLFFYHSHVSFLSYTLYVDPSFSILVYIKKLIINTHYFFDPYIMILLAVPLLILYKQSIKSISKNIFSLLTIGTLLYLLGHYIAQPEVTIRYFCADSIFVVSVTIITIYNRFVLRNESSVPNVNTAGFLD
jgi:hypothetical protein